MKSTVPFLNVAVPVDTAIAIEPSPGTLPAESCSIDAGVNPTTTGVDLVMVSADVRTFVESGNPDANQSWEIGYAEPSEPDA